MEGAFLAEGGLAWRGELGPDHFTLRATVHTHHTLTPRHHMPYADPMSPTCAHFSPPEKAQDSENAFHSETYQPGLQATQ